MDVAMRLVYAITLSAFAKAHEDAKEIEDALRALVPFDFEKEKLKVQVQNAEGFESTIRIITIQLTKVTHTNEVLKFLFGKLEPEQKDALKEQTESRLDESLDYFVRFDKTEWVNERKLVITDTGNCIHCKIALAVYPKKRELAVALVQRLLMNTS